MSRLSIMFGPPHVAPIAAGSGADRGIRGALWTANVSTVTELVTPPRHGCTVVRRISDDRGREWRVRQLWSENCHGLLFQCTVRGIRSEVRPMRAPLESLSDDELLIALAPADD